MSNFFRQKEKIEKEITREIKKSYKRVANNLIKRLALVNPDAMTYAYLIQTAKYLEKEYKKLNKRLNKEIEKAITSTVESYTQSQIEFYSDLCKPLSSSFEDMFAKVNKQVLDNVITGKMYNIARPQCRRVRRLARRPRKHVPPQDPGGDHGRIHRLRESRDSAPDPGQAGHGPVPCRPPGHRQAHRMSATGPERDDRTPRAVGGSVVRDPAHSADP